MNEDTWLRARAWALWKAIFELCQIADKNSGVIGSLTKPETSTWYSTLNRSALTPPNYVFQVAR